MTDTKKMRDEFEAAVKAKWPGIRMLRVNRPGSPVDGEYELTGLEGAWWGWKASRQAVVVELPELVGITNAEEVDGSVIIPKVDQAYDQAIQECREAIEAAGLRVKE